MKSTFAWIGVVALLAWTGGGLAAWLLAREGVTLVVASGDSSRSVAEDPIARLEDRVEELARGQDALVAALESHFARIDSSADQPVDAASVRPARAPSTAPSAGLPVQTTGAPPDATPGEAPGGRASAPKTPAPSFLAFRLPTDDFRFDERRSWSILPDRSRAGFDGKSTLHDFTGATTAVTGTLACDLSRPDAEPTGSIRVEAARLDTGEADRDADMREYLDAGAHREIVFRLERFETRTVDAATQTVAGTAHGRMTIRGVERPLAMPVTATVDAGRRLELKGEAPLALSDFGVHVPSKFGLISMEDEVLVWIALRAKLEPRSAQ